jgi:hypothetical protein
MGNVRAEISRGSVATGTMHRFGIYGEIHVILMYRDRDKEAL